MPLGDLEAEVYHKILVVGADGPLLGVLKENLRETDDFRIETAAYLLRWDLLHERESLARFRTCELRGLCAEHGVDPVPLLRTIERSVGNARLAGKIAAAASA